MPAYYPPVGFHFRVEVQDLVPPKQNDLRFSEVGGLATEMATEEVPEGAILPDGRIASMAPGALRLWSPQDDVVTTFTEPRLKGHATKVAGDGNHVTDAFVRGLTPTIDSALSSVLFDGHSQ